MKQTIKKLVKCDPADSQKGSGRSWTTTTLENEEAVADLVCVQEDQRGTHIHPRSIAKELDISRSSVRRIIKNKGIKQFKQFKAQYMNDTKRTRRVEHASVLLEKFKYNPWMIEHAVFQDESDLLNDISCFEMASGDETVNYQ